MECPRCQGRHLAEVYPCTTLVGAPELGYDVERPIYKRRPKSVPVSEFPMLRAANCDGLVRRIMTLSGSFPAVDFGVASDHADARS